MLFKNTPRPSGINVSSTRIHHNFDYCLLKNKNSLHRPSTCQWGSSKPLAEVDLCPRGWSETTIFSPDIQQPRLELRAPCSHQRSPVLEPGSSLSTGWHHVSAAYHRGSQDDLRPYKAKHWINIGVHKEITFHSFLSHFFPQISTRRKSQSCFHLSLTPLYSSSTKKEQAPGSDERPVENLIM